MKKTTIINNNTQTFTESLQESHMKEMFLVYPEFDNGDYYTLKEITKKNTRYTHEYASVMRSTNPKFPHPVAIRTSNMGGMSYLYSLSEYNEFTKGSDDRNLRALERARKLEAEAGRIRYRLKRTGFSVSVKETTNKGAK